MEGLTTELDNRFRTEMRRRSQPRRNTGYESPLALGRFDSNKPHAKVAKVAKAA